MPGKRITKHRLHVSFACASAMAFLGLGVLSEASAQGRARESVPSTARPQRRTLSPADKLYSQFQTPPRRYGLRPYWFWNDRVDSIRLAQQIQMMSDQGVSGAHVFPIDGLRTPYLTEEWFKAFGASLAKAEQLGFDLNFIIDFDWPDGEARDPWLLQPVQSRVVRANPAFRMRSLDYVRKEAHGPCEVNLQAPARIEFAVAARALGDEKIDGDSLILIETGGGGQRLTWTAPEGDWQVVAYYLMESEGADGGQVDLLNPQATQAYIRIALDPYYQRFGKAFGKNISYLVADHEGDYGYRIAWTPELFETFQKEKGYDLRKFLPLLLYEGGRLTPKVRCDYLEVISEIYGKSFFDQLQQWAESRHTRLISHLWESPLLFNASSQGDYFGEERRLSLAGCDTLMNWEHWPRDFMEAASVAHFQRVGFWVENQGLEGADSYTDLGTMRTGTYLIGAWGATLLTPFFNYESRKVLYPPDWFYDQPFWKYFRSYAELARRITFMNDGAQKVANVAIFQPLETVWAESSSVFDERTPYPDGGGKKIAALTEQDYSSLMYLLTSHQWNYDIMDSFYLKQAELVGPALRLGGDDYRALILPPLSTVRRSTFEKVMRFYDAGGLVIALGTLPRNSMEYGEDDPELGKLVAWVFGPDRGHVPYSLHRNEAGGRAYFIPGEAKEALKWSFWHGSNDVREMRVPEHVQHVLAILEKEVPKDLRVLEGPSGGLVFNHMVRQGVHFYWMVNDSDKPRTNHLLLSLKGDVQRWQADTGKRTSVYHHATPEGTEVRLRLEPGDGCYLVFTAGPRQEEEVELSSTNLEDFKIVASSESSIRVAVNSRAAAGKNYVEFTRGGRHFRGEITLPESVHEISLPDTWRFKPLVSSVEVPYARTAVDPNGAQGLEWGATNLDDSKWESQWVSSETDSVRDWYVLGPFADENHAGFFSELPPEKSIDLSATFEGRGGKSIRWQPYSSPDYAVNLAIPIENKGQRWGVAYALTYVYSPDRRQAEVRTAAPNFAEWENGKRVAVQHTHAFYYPPVRAWGIAEKVQLDAGWNSLLIKLENDRGDFGLEFASWVTDLHSPSALVTSPTKTLPDRARLDAGFRWYRYRIPPGTVGLIPPATHRPVEVFVNGRKVQPGKDGVIPYTWLPGEHMVAAIRLRGTAQIYDGPRFVTGLTSFHLQSWSDTALENYSGDAEYVTGFDLPAEYLKHHVLLDLGDVGVAAEIWVNGRHAGTRLWKPYAIDVTSFVRPGRNQLRVVVTNSEGNKIAVGARRGNLARIRINGLLGPVRIVPYLREDLVCQRR